VASQEGLRPHGVSYGSSLLPVASNLCGQQRVSMLYGNISYTQSYSNIGIASSNHACDIGR
jgi:hypothetical protein